MDFISIPLLVASSLVLLSLLAGMLSTRVGFPFLLVFLVAGVLAGEDGIGRIDFSDFHLSFWVGNIALAVILLDGGLRTSYSTFRTGLKPSLALATIGVAISAALTGLAAMALLDLEWRQGMLLGAIVGSTDAAAVFALLRRSGVTLNERVGATLEIESGMNDPMAIYLTLTFIALIAATETGSSAWSQALLALMQQFGWGATLGLASGLALVELTTRLPWADSDRGIAALIVASAGLVVFSITGWLGGSGFLAIYLFGLIVRNRGGRRVENLLSAMDGFAWLAQASIFLLLGLLVTPSAILETAASAIAVAAVLMFVARPVAVWVCLAPFRFRREEVWFISWVGLRGAVPVVLAIFPLMANVPGAMLLFNVAFAVVLASLLLQGTTIGFMARKLGVALPDRSDERGVRALFGDFTLDAAASIGSICDFYGLPWPEKAELTLGQWIADRLGHPPVVGDTLPLGSATLSVRAMDGARITAVGIKLSSTLGDGSDELAGARRADAGGTGESGPHL